MSTKQKKIHSETFDSKKLRRLAFPNERYQSISNFYSQIPGSNFSFCIEISLILYKTFESVR